MTTDHAKAAIDPDGDTERVSVLIAGAGPVGLTLALELERHGIDALLVERNVTTTRHPKMDITNGRSMELFRRLGVAERLRELAVPADHDMSVTWVTELDGWELARFRYPSVNQQRTQTRMRNDGGDSLEPNMRVSQALLEPALRDWHENRSHHIRIRYGWQVESFTQDSAGVDVVLYSPHQRRRQTVRATFLAGCDGAGSQVRQGLGIELDTVDLPRLAALRLGLRRTLGMLARAWLANRERPTDGRFYMVHFTSRDPILSQRFGTAWHLQSPQGWTLISQNDDDVWTFHCPLGIGINPDEIDPRAMLFAHLGTRIDCDIVLANVWTPRLSVAQRFGRGRVWLAGDAVHQVPPTGGYGMNTGVGDAVGLGWALAANIQGWGTPRLLGAYEIERRAVALRNRDAAGRHAIVRVAIKAAFRRSIHCEGWNGEYARRRLGREIIDLGNLENEAFGIEWGYRYDQSPVIAKERGPAPIQRMDSYRPTTSPGARPPSVYLADGRAVFDLFATGFTLLRFADIDTEALVAAAAARGVPLDVVDIRDEHARCLYERELVLIRPDQHVAWRGDMVPDNPFHVVDIVRGGAPASTHLVSQLQALPELIS
jgi:2-polyprenyl-6-methoxyphenol hydroxylase-like FAD-dependent oxidoreductase